MKELGYFLTDCDAILGMDSLNGIILMIFYEVLEYGQKWRNSGISRPIVMILGMYSSDGILLMIFIFGSGIWPEIKDLGYFLTDHGPEIVELGYFLTDHYVIGYLQFIWDSITNFWEVLK